MTNKPKQSSLDTTNQDIKAGNFDQDFVSESGKIAIVDAALLDGIRNRLVDKAIIVPTISVNSVFIVQGRFDDAILRSLKIFPKKDQEGNIHLASNVDSDSEVIKPKKTSEPQESLSNDPKMAQKIRKLTGGRKEKDRLSGDARSNRTRGPRKRHTVSPESPISTAVGRKGKASPSGQRAKTRRANNRGDGSAGAAAKRRIKFMESGIPEDVKQIYEFMYEYANKEVTFEAIDSINDKSLFECLLTKMLHMSLSGWYEKEEILEHNLGTTVSAADWAVQDGILFSKESGRRPNIDFTWVYNTRQILQEYIVDQNKNLDVDMVLEGLKNVGRPII